MLKPTYQVINEDCYTALQKLPDNSIDAIATDPPYGISFMASEWDSQVPPVKIWQEVLRVLKPGAHALVACGTRTQHLMATNLEQAGFQIRDVITWHYCTGFPKSQNVSKTIDAALNATRTKIKHPAPRNPKSIRGGKDVEGGDRPYLIKAREVGYHEIDDDTPITPEATLYQGYGSALKPSTEFFTLCRKPLAEPTLAKNVLKHQTGALNIDVSRIPMQDGDRDRSAEPSGQKLYATNNTLFKGDHTQITTNPLGRFPSNTIFDTQSAAILDEQTGNLTSGSLLPSHNTKTKAKNCYGQFAHNNPSQPFGGDEGGGSRFFHIVDPFKYVPKPSQLERDLGLPEGMSNDHPTCKPISLMQYLVKLITPPATPTFIPTVLDPFTGSGTTGAAAAIEGVSFIGMELDAHFTDIAQQRINYFAANRHHFLKTDQDGKQRKTQEAAKIAKATPNYVKPLFSQHH